MKLSYAITVCNEINEIKKLLPFIIQNKDINDEIVVLYDKQNGSEDVLNYLSEINDIKLHIDYFDSHFDKWKNKLNSFCKGDFIFQIDADEMISEFLIKHIRSIILSNPDVELFFLPRINIVEGILFDDLVMWNWRMNEKGWINWPDKQGRIYKKNLNWGGYVHESIKNAKIFSSLPNEEEYSLLHIKTINKQKRQNDFYSNL